MQLKAAFLAAASLTLTSGWITGLTAPSTIALDTDFTVTLISSGYIQTVYEAAVSFGLLSINSDPSDQPYGLGTPFDTSLLGPSDSNTYKSIPLTVNIPSTDFASAADNSTFFLVASVFRLFGALAEPAITGFNVTVTLGDVVSTKTVTSLESFQFL